MVGFGFVVRTLPNTGISIRTSSDGTSIWGTGNSPLGVRTPNQPAESSHEVPTAWKSYLPTTSPLTISEINNDNIVKNKYYRVRAIVRKFGRDCVRAVCSTNGCFATV